MEEIIKEIKPVNKLYIKWIDDILGWGVFSENKIKEGELVESCYCVMDNYITSPLKDYIFGHHGSLDVYHCFGFGPIYNHNDLPNIRWKKDPYNPIINFYAIKDIECGEEICHNYGSTYWVNKNKKVKKII